MAIFSLDYTVKLGPLPLNALSPHRNDVQICILYALCDLFDYE